MYRERITHTSQIFSAFNQLYKERKIKVYFVHEHNVFSKYILNAEPLIA